MKINNEITKILEIVNRKNLKIFYYTMNVIYFRFDTNLTHMFDGTTAETDGEHGCSNRPSATAFYIVTASHAGALHRRAAKRAHAKLTIE